MKEWSGNLKCSFTAVDASGCVLSWSSRKDPISVLRSFCFSCRGWSEHATWRCDTLWNVKEIDCSVPCDSVVSATFSLIYSTSGKIRTWAIFNIRSWLQSGGGSTVQMIALAQMVSGDPKFIILFHLSDSRVASLSDHDSQLSIVRDLWIFPGRFSHWIIDNTVTSFDLSL